ncbi:hypothetical protein CLV59_104105 [Chitinophaga dinghuensis]|uniref:Uncharacterized protein n=1 Tax=Chitinophaga dinghuensis TaxID=1539050 RepID=A0A327W0G8_9BACT|nr:hypothetical protein [Chitinophaga dinghuensis]RAJ81880.1 hypothetical protein CLV59_104105 [Chitinophaga dinghuensis]
MENQRPNSFSCEPFRSWNRLESRPRAAEFDKALEFGVYDALWMLTRQWQFGELKGEDAGSAIYSKICLQSTEISRFKTANGPVQQMVTDMPLESVIEDTPVTLLWKDKLQAAYYFLNCLDRAAAANNVAAYNRSAYRKAAKNAYKIPAVSGIAENASRNEIIAGSAQLADEELVAVIQANSSRYFDGYALYMEAVNNLSSAVVKIAKGNPTGGNNQFIEQALQTYVNWFSQTYKGQLQPSTPSAWAPRQMEYQFACALPDSKGSNTILTASEYSSGDLEWYSMDVDRTTNIAGLSGAATPEEAGKIKTVLQTVIPQPATFAGAPNARLWQFEDGNIDLGNIQADATDISKVIFTEYALLYNTDWMVAPMPVKTGTLSEIKGIVVTDVFGEQTFVQPALQGETGNWRAWGMYNLTVAGPNNNLPADTRLLLAPATVKTMESTPVEEVHFVRDEMSNHVWAVEVQLPGQLGNSLDGHAYTKNVQRLLATFDPPAPVESAPENALYQYKLGNTVPHNWIPFVPVHLPGNMRQVQLQRASMPLLLKNEYSHVRPRTKLLRYGLNDMNEQQTPYFIHEEEVPRAGVKLQATYQRTRWYNGKIINWYGISKSTGRGEGSSGLKYDQITRLK